MENWILLSEHQAIKKLFLNLALSSLETIIYDKQNLVNTEYEVGND